MVKKVTLLLTLLAVGLVSIFSNSNNEAAAQDGKVKIVMHLNALLDDQGIMDSIEELKLMDKYSNVEIVVKAKDADYFTKMPISVAGGEQIDIIAVQNTINKTNYADSSVIIPLDDMIKDLNIDFDKAFGGQAELGKVNGQTFVIPQRRSMWVLNYNKSVFDKAGLPYPDAKVPMTWDEYAVLAKKLTSGEGAEKTYGALHMTWPIFWYGSAIMELGSGADFYNEEGLSNIDNPAFTKALERSFKMMNIDKSIPAYTTMITSKVQTTAFMNGKYGMLPSASWVLNWGIDKERFPRDWKLGVAPLPVDSGTAIKSWGDVRGYGIPQSAKHPELALEICMDLAKMAAETATADPHSFQVADKSNLFNGIAAGLANDGITKEELNYTFNNPEVIYSVEKIVGPKNVEYDKIVSEEVEKYFIEAQTLEQTLKNIKTRADKAILK